MADCISGDISCWISSQTNIITNIANNLVPVENLITGGAYIMGIGFALRALNCLKQHGERSAGAQQQSSGLKEPLIYFIVAAVFLYFPTALSLLMNSTFGYSSVLAYAPVNSNNQQINTIFGSGSEVGRALSLIIQVIGLVAFIKGWLLISKSASQGQPPGGTSKGLVHVFGGILAMNMVGTLQILNNTLYGSS